MKSFAFESPTFDLTTVGTLDPVLLVRLVFQVGHAIGSTEGSGFFLDVWQSSLVTAAHVVAVPDGAVPLRVELQVFGQGGSVTGHAGAIAYPDIATGRTDVAVVRLPMARPDQRLDMSTGPVPLGSFDATVFGRANGALQRVPVSVNAQGGLLSYRPSDAGQGGMSGGPLRTANAVVGIHLGQAPGMASNGATPISDTLLGQLLDAATAAEEARG